MTKKPKRPRGRPGPKTKHPGKEPEAHLMRFTKRINILTPKVLKKMGVRISDWGEDHMIADAKRLGLL